MRTEFYKGADGKWYWRVKARNGEVIADGSEGYASLGNVKRAYARLFALMTAKIPKTMLQGETV